MHMSNFVLGGRPLNFQTMDVLSPAPAPPPPFVQLFQAINADLSGSGFGIQGQKSTGSTVPLIDRLTVVVCPVLSTRLFHAGLVVRGGAHSTCRLFQTLAALKDGF